MARFVLICSLLLSALTMQVSLASAQEYGPSVGFTPPELEPRPRNGIAALIVGGVLMGGLEALAMVGLCGVEDPFIEWESEHKCRVVNGTGGALSLGIGISLLTVGLIRRKKYKAWRDARSRTAQLLERVELTSLAGGSGLSWSTRF